MLNFQLWSSFNPYSTWASDEPRSWRYATRRRPGPAVISIPEGLGNEKDIVYNIRAQFPRFNTEYGFKVEEWNDREKMYKFVSEYRVSGDRLYTSDNRWIKVFHYCSAFGNIHGREFIDKVEQWKRVFSDETKAFFKEHCSVGTFFEEDYEI